ncbi:MAG TPA: bacterial transcriptional activator domain-containing protein [Aggregatilinea sp.]|uniref:AfsR/SARP family transcriptional regulator n=1 Tax=Aggregatilinea sp. TaxID=2806333 RepID=UPI002C828273|nr:bacterial transcriptional activator domain-containing protein [Aggregatilinea sp.]HML20136.1 bacterial transcriptional activator domain-containing protein [Aggregatilinea sp.]
MRVFYYAMGPDDVNVQSFLSGITHDLANQHPTFGRHLNQIHFESQPDHAELLEAFVQDVEELSDEPFLLILDEYDRTDSADDLQAFVEQAIVRLTPDSKLVINSRTLPRLPWVSLIAQRKAVVLEDDKVVATDFYDMKTDGANLLEVNALGPGYVLLNNQPVDTWEGHLPRLLFFFALDRPVVTRSEICQAFWPDLDNDQAVNVFHVTKRRLHKALDFDVLVHEGGYYRVNPDVSVNYDIMSFVGALVKGRSPETTDKAAAWQEAIDLYRGPFLQGHSDDWIMERRQEYQAGYLEALSEMARIRLDEGRQEHALGLLLRAVGENDRFEPIHRQIMQLYADLGRRSEAAGHYQKLVERLRSDGRAPEAETQALYQSIMS